MGIEFTVSSFEEMCDLMCDNKIPEKKPMKAWKVFDANEWDCGVQIVFAETREKAKVLMYRSENFEDTEWNDLRAKRFKEFDKYYKGTQTPDVWLDDEMRTILVRDYGWSCVETFESECKICPAKKWCRLESDT